MIRAAARRESRGLTIGATAMAKGQMRPTKEKRKPKKNAGKKAAK